MPSNTKQTRKILTILSAITLIGLFIFALISNLHYLHTTSHKSWLLSSWNILQIVAVVAIVIVLILENRSYDRTLAWILILLFIPLLGVILYLFFGRNFRKRRIFKKKELDDLQLLEDIDKPVSLPANPSILVARVKKIIHLLEVNSKSQLSLRNEIDMFTKGEDAFERLMAACHGAKESIHLEFFSIGRDKTSLQFIEILSNLSLKGIKIRFLYDHVGSWDFRKKDRNKLHRAGVELCAFHRVIFPFLSSRLNYRNHRKLVIIDGMIAFLGGINIGDKYVSKSHYFGEWRDTFLLVHGEAIYSLQKLFLLDWYFASKQLVLDKRLFPAITTTSKQFIQIVPSGPDSDWENILQAYFTAITIAQSYIYITSPYLILNDSLLTALKTAALSGVDVRILIPGKPDHLIVFWGSRSFYYELLEAGIRIFEYQNGFIHAKTLVADDTVCSVGTANMDLRSFTQNFEVSAMLYGKKTAVALKEQFLADCNYSKEILFDDIKNRHITRQLVESIARLFSPLL